MAFLLGNARKFNSASKSSHQANGEVADEDFNLPSDRDKEFESVLLKKYEEECEDIENEEGCTRKALIIAREALAHLGFYKLADKIRNIKSKMDGGKTIQRKARGRKRTIKRKRVMNNYNKK